MTLDIHRVKSVQDKIEYFDDPEFGKDPFHVRTITVSDWDGAEVTIHLYADSPAMLASRGKPAEST